MHQFLVALILTLCLVSGQEEIQRVNVDVYYESLCPDSIKFFTQQLYPSLQGNLSKFVNLTLLPYGKSKTTEQIPGQYEFNCHHGPAECKGNRIQVCALHLIDNGKKSDNLGYNKIATAFINCLMAKVKRDGDNTDFPTQDCATINQVPILAQINNCANDVEGSKYLRQAGLLTESLSPPLTSVPTIVFNKQFKQDDNDLAQSNFVKALCQYVKGAKPAECTKNGGAMFQFNYVLFVLSALVFYSW